MERIRASVRRLVESYEKTGGKTGFAPEEEEKIIARIETSIDRHDLLNCDIIIEAVTEDEPVKRQVILSLTETRLPEVNGFKYVLDFNYPAGRRVLIPEKFMGMHFMNPVPIQPGCELIRGFLTSEETFQLDCGVLPRTRQGTDPS